MDVWNGVVLRTNVYVQELEPEIELLCSQLLSRLDANVEEIQQLLVNTDSQKVTVFHFLAFITEPLLSTSTNYFYVYNILRHRISVIFMQ